MTIQRLTTGDFGLDLVLGEGVATLARMDGLEPSASILIRGGPGAGKTLLGSQLAITLAEQRGGDVAYACVELLPTELHAQLESVWHDASRSPPFNQLVGSAVADRFRVPPFRTRSETPQHAHVYASTLPLNAGNELEAFGGAIEEMLGAIARSGGKPSALVIDSLAHGYGLADAPREFADSLIKLAVERGLVLILLEEADTGKQLSEWSYASDIAIELDHLDRSSNTAAQLERRLWVTKNRFGPTAAGPHRFSIIEKHGVRVFPAEVTYVTPWARRIGRDWKASSARLEWGIPDLVIAAGFEGLVPSQNEIVLVHGPESDLVRSAARLLLGARDGVDVWIDLARVTARERDRNPRSLRVEVGNPMLSPQRLLWIGVEALHRLGRANATINRVVIGDIAALDMFYGADDLRRALAILLGVLQRAGLPVVLFQTASGMAARFSQEEGGPGSMRFGALPTLLDWADTTVEIIPPDDRGPASTLRLMSRETGLSVDLKFSRTRARSLLYP